MRYFVRSKFGKFTITQMSLDLNLAFDMYRAAIRRGHNAVTLESEGRWQI